MLSLLIAPAISLTPMAPNCQPTMAIVATTTPRCKLPTMDAALSRRGVLSGLLLTPSAAFASDADLECEDDDTACREKRQKAIKEQIKQRAKRASEKRIEESKKGPVRKPTDLVENRKKTVDYSCVAATGSPCPTVEEAD